MIDNILKLIESQMNIAVNLIHPFTISLRE